MDSTAHFVAILESLNDLKSLLAHAYTTSYYYSLRAPADDPFLPPPPDLPLDIREQSAREYLFHPARAHIRRALLCIPNDFPYTEDEREYIGRVRQLLSLKDHLLNLDKLCKHALDGDIAAAIEAIDLTENLHTDALAYFGVYRPPPPRLDIFGRTILPSPDSPSPTGQLPTPRSRLRTERLPHDNRIWLDTIAFARIADVAINFFDALIAAPGEFLSASEFGFKTDHKEALPRELQQLLESKPGGGTRLKKEAYKPLIN